MLKPLTQCGLSIVEMFERGIQKYQVALDVETGDYMTASRGRGKGGRNKYFLHRDGETKIIRAFDLEEALMEANRQSC